MIRSLPVMTDLFLAVCRIILRFCLSLMFVFLLPFFPIFPDSLVSERYADTDQKSHDQNGKIHSFTSHFFVFKDFNRYQYGDGIHCSDKDHGRQHEQNRGVDDGSEQSALTGGNFSDEQQCG